MHLCKALSADSSVGVISSSVLAPGISEMGVCIGCGGAPINCAGGLSWAGAMYPGGMMPTI